MGTRRDRAELEARRLQGARLLRQGVKPAEVARRLKVSRTSVWRWGQALAANGRRALGQAPRTGRPPRLSEANKKQLLAALKAGALPQGYSTDPWTLARVGTDRGTQRHKVFGIRRVPAAQEPELLLPASERTRQEAG
jgi:transposase